MLYLGSDDLKDVFVGIFFVFERVGECLESAGVLLERVDESVKLADASRLDAIAADEVAQPEVGPMIPQSLLVFLLRRRLAGLSLETA